MRRSAGYAHSIHTDSSRDPALHRCDSGADRIAHAQDAADATTLAPDPIACQSSAGARQHCPANTSSGVALLKSTGAAACLLGKTWGYDDTGIWVSDGCSGEFVAGAVAEPPADPACVLNAGFLLFSVDKG